MRRDLVSGLALLIIGIGYSIYAYQKLPLGTLTRMGPGMFPFGLGLLLVLFGAAIAATSLAGDHRIGEVDYRVAGSVLGSIAAFALLIRPAGLGPAVVGSTVVMSFALPRTRPTTTLAIALGLVALCWLIFVFLLGIRIPLVQWRP